jgi:hypothetical protein
MPCYIGGRKDRTISDAEILRLYVDEGMDSDSIGAAAQCSAATVLAIVRAHGGIIRPPGGKRRNPVLKIPVAEIIRRYREGQSGPLIADAAGCTASTLYRLLRSHGVTIRAGISKRAARNGR